MTLITIFNCVPTDQRELAVVKSRTFPGIDRMAEITIRREARLHMVRVRGGIIVLLMAGHTVCRQTGINAAVMTRIAVHGAMPTRKWKFGVIEHCTFPGIHRVSGLHFCT